MLYHDRETGFAEGLELLAGLLQRYGTQLYQQWSWGSENDKGIFLRVWLHEIENGKAIIRNIHQKKSAGLTERERHLSSLNQGKPGYAVILRSKDPLAEKNAIESYERVIYRITKIEKDSRGVIWAEIDMDSPISPQDI